MSSEVKTAFAMCSVMLLLFCAIASVLATPAINLIPCDSKDDQCVLKAVKEAYTSILDANKAIGAESMDPMHHEVIEGNLSILKFKLFNTTVIGFKSCEVKSAKFDAAKLTFHVDLRCPHFGLSGQYDIDGRLIVLPVKGDGDYKLDAKTISLIVDAELKIAPGKDGKNYMSVKNFKVKPEVLEGVVFDFKNLFNGQKDLSDEVHKFANENWKETANEVQDPVFTAAVKKFVQNANKYLKTVSVEDYLKQ